MPAGRVPGPGARRRRGHLTGAEDDEVVGSAKNLYTDGFHKKKPENLANSIAELLDHRHAARLKKDLNIRGFHELKGDRKGTYAWKVTANMRLTFRFEKGDAFGVALEDYH